MRSWRHQRRGSARRALWQSGRGEGLRGSSVDPETAGLLECGTLLKALTECLFQQPNLISRPSPSPSSGTRVTRLASTTTTKLALLQSAPSTIFCKRSAYSCIQTNTPSRSSHPRGPFIPAPGSSAAPAQAVEHASLTPAVPTPMLRASLQAVPERQPPVTLAVGPLSSESTVPTLRLSVPPHSLSLSACGAQQAAPLHAWRRAPHLRVHCIDAAAVNCHCHFSTLQLTGSPLHEDYKSSTLKYIVSN